MSTEEIKQALIAEFNLPDGSVRTPRARRIFLEVSREDFRKVFDYAVKELGFVTLCTITGLDEQDKFGVIYHLAQDRGTVLNLKIRLPKENPILKTITPDFSNADIYERELVDLLGIEVEGLPPGNRYPLPDEWPENQFPLRKDWKKENPQVSETSGGTQNA